MENNPNFQQGSQNWNQPGGGPYTYGPPWWANQGPWGAPPPGEGKTEQDQAATNEKREGPGGPNDYGKYGPGWWGAPPWGTWYGAPNWNWRFYSMPPWNSFNYGDYGYNYYNFQRPVPWTYGNWNPWSYAFGYYGGNWNVPWGYWWNSPTNLGNPGTGWYPYWYPQGYDNYGYWGYPYDYNTSYGYYPYHGYHPSYGYYPGYGYNYYGWPPRNYDYGHAWRPGWTSHGRPYSWFGRVSPWWANEFFRPVGFSAAA